MRSESFLLLAISFLKLPGERGHTSLQTEGERGLNVNRVASDARIRSVLFEESR